MSRPRSQYSDTKDKLIDDIVNFGFREFEVSKTLLELKSSEAIEKQTKSLTRATWVLAATTIGLVFVTLMLVFVSLKNTAP